MFYKKGTLQILGKTTTADWRQLIVDPAIKQDPSQVTAERDLPLELSPDRFAFYRARAVSAMEMHSANQNGDAFPTEELERNYKSFLRRGIYRDHNADVPEKACGIIVDAIWHPKLGYVECLFAIDKETDGYKDVEAGKINSVSMGALVQRCECSYCGQSSYTEDTYCTHLKHSLNREIQGKKVYAINRGVNFYELSLVGTPADSDAHILQRVASRTDNWRGAINAITCTCGVAHDQTDATHGGTVAGSVGRETPEERRKCLQCGGSCDVPSAVLSSQGKFCCERCRTDFFAASKGATTVTNTDPQATARLNNSAVNNFVKAALELLAAGQNPELITKTASVLATVEPTSVEAEKRPEAPSMKEVKEKAQVLYEKEKEKAEKGPDSVEPAPAVTPAPAAETPKSASSQASKEKITMSELAIKFYQGANPETSFLVARKGRLRTAVSLAALEAATKKEAAGKVDTSKQEKADNELVDGKDSAQPSDKVKSLGDVDKSQQDKPSHELVDGKDSAQPSDIVKKYAALAGGSISKLASLWGTQIAYIPAVKKEAVKKKALIADKGNFAKEETNKPSDPMDKNAEQWAKEKADKLGQPGGSRGGEVKKYFNQYDTKTLAEGTKGTLWAREEAAKKVASLETELAQVKAALADTQKKQAIAAKAGLVNAIVEMEKQAGLLEPTSGAVLEIEETDGLPHAEAKMKADAQVKLARIDKLNALDEAALQELKNTLNATAAARAQAKTAEKSVIANLTPAVYSDESAVEDPAEKLAKIWDR